jgi:hypothetical protein
LRVCAVAYRANKSAQIRFKLEDRFEDFLKGFAAISKPGVNTARHVRGKIVKHSSRTFEED